MADDGQLAVSFSRSRGKGWLSTRAALFVSQCFAGLSECLPRAGLSSDERGDDGASRAPGNGGGRLPEAVIGVGLRCAAGSGGGRLPELVCAGSFAGGELDFGRFDGLDSVAGLGEGGSERAAAPGRGGPFGMSELVPFSESAPPLACCAPMGFAATGRGGRDLDFTKLGSRPTETAGGRRVADIFPPRVVLNRRTRKRRPLDGDG